MKLNEAEMRMAYQIEATSQSAALNEIYMTWRYTQGRETMHTERMQVLKNILKNMLPKSNHK